MPAAPLLIAALLPTWQDPPAANAAVAPPAADAAPAGDELVRRAEAELDAALDAPLGERFAAKPGDTLAAALDQLFDGAGIFWRPDASALELEGLTLEDIALERPPAVPAGRFPVRRALELLLEPAEIPLTYQNDGGVLRITTRTEAEETLVLHVYDVRDILEAYAVAARAAWVPTPPVVYGGGGGALGGGGGGLGGGGGAFSVAPQLGGGGLGTGGAAYGPFSHFQQRPTLAQAAVAGYGPLIDLIVASTGGSDRGGEWEQNGGFGSIEEFNGTLVVRQTHAVHRQLARLLGDLRGVDGGMVWSIPEPADAEDATAAGDAAEVPGSEPYVREEPDADAAE